MGTGGDRTGMDLETNMPELGELDSNFDEIRAAVEKLENLCRDKIKSDTNSDNYLKVLNRVLHAVHKSIALIHTGKLPGTDPDDSSLDVAPRRLVAKSRAKGKSAQVVGPPKGNGPASDTGTSEQNVVATVRGAKTVNQTKPEPTQKQRDRVKRKTSVGEEVVSSAPPAKHGEVVGKRKRSGLDIDDSPGKKKRLDASRADSESEAFTGLYIYVATSVSEVDRERFRERCAKLKWNWLTSVTDQVTHFVVASSLNLTRRSVNLLEAMLWGAWIVDKKWLEKSTRRKAFVDEEPHEIAGLSRHGAKDGPRKARRNYAENGPKLFEGLTFFMEGEFTTPKSEELERLIHSGGGKVTGIAPKKSNLKKAASFFPHANKKHFAALCRNFIVSESADMDDQALVENGCAKVPPSWILDSIERFSFADF